ncbi:MAG TPA: nucleotidyltransferase family protein [Chloroflexota bacterium]|nr:nucleotidyltransferase family protein [Chloroflexota bacterium]
MAKAAPVQTALVLAAGKSTRIQPVAPDRPKPLIVVAGQTVLERNLRQLAAAGVRDVWINLHYRGEQIAALIGDGARLGLHVRYSWEPDLLGTAGAAKKLEAALAADTFLVVYGDNLTALDLAALTAQHRARAAVATIAVFDRDRVPNTGLAGGRVVVDAEGRVMRFVEGGAADSPYVNAGVYALEPRVLAAIAPGAFADFGRDVFPLLLEHGARVDAFPIDGYCLGIDTPEGLARANALVADLEGAVETLVR